eukprot:CAMPEP_0119039930 /NCGR_PEP_ID=MMETSP1177-20130426/9710_1 /TAXON_ID=2985 /ORGANISM="Ochromonas sp, Strain CCMP1899" /LENGTH=221 /DNA_ID=CAMNT_0007004473 /DNA_START=328 /DNA_END=990 /DNA_ORIENTATION=+
MLRISLGRLSHLHLKRLYSSKRTIKNCKPGGLPNIDVVIARSDKDIQLWLDKITSKIEKQNAKDGTKKIVKNTQNDTHFSKEKSDNENSKIENIKFVIGLDVEWRPDFQGGGGNKVALVQLSTQTSAILIQMKYIDHYVQSLSTLRKILLSEDIIKVGVGIVEDLIRLEKDHGFKYTTYCDIGAAAKRFDKKISKFGLISLENYYFELDLKKPKSVQMSNW